MRLFGGRVPRRAIHLILALAAWCAVGAAARAQPLPPGPGGPGDGGPSFRPQAMPLAELSPRVSGNSFVSTWRPEDLGGGPGSTGVVLHPKTGFVYVGNSQGVLEFDGARWQLIPLRNAGAVQALAADAAGVIWVAAENELARLVPAPDGALHAETVLYPLPEGEAGNCEQMLATPAGVWVRGLQHIWRLGADGKAETWRSGERFGALWWMDDALHCKVAEREVVRLDPDGRLAPVVARDSLRIPTNRPSPFRVFASRRLADGDWLLLTALGPARWRGETKSWRPYPMRPPLFREMEAIAGTFLPDGSMVLITSRPGGMLLRPDGRVERMIDRLPNIINTRVVQLAADAEGGLWVTSRDTIARVQLRSIAARHEGAQGLTGNPRQLLRHREELIVAHSAGVSRHAEWPGSFPLTEGLHRGAEALALVGDRVFAAATGLVELVDSGRGARTVSDLPITTLTGVRGVDDTILGGDARGVWWFRRHGLAWQPAGRVAGIETGVAALFDQGDGQVWGATRDGRIWRADFRGGVRLDAPVAVYGPLQGVPAPLRPGRINFFPLGATVAATCPTWLLRYDAARDRFEPESRIAGLAAPGVRGAEAVGVRPDGTTWLRMGPGDRRILKVSPDGADRWRTDELRAPMIRDLAAVHLCEDRGTLWVAGKEMLVSLDLGWTAPAAPALAVRWRAVTATDGRILWRGEAPAEPLALATGDSAVRIEFAAPSYVADHRGKPVVRFRSQLDGFERDWSGWSAEAWRDFSRLPAGNYVFRVQATDQAGRMSPELEMALRITAPWWRSSWAVLGYCAAAGAGLMAGVRLRTRALRRRAQQLEAMVAARTEELRRSNVELARLHRLELDEKAAARLAEEEARLEVLRYQLNPHFLYNALNSIYSLVLTAPPAAAGMVLRLADFCRVALDRRREEHTTVGAEFDKLSLYFEIEKVRWGDSLHIEVRADESARRAALPPFLLLPLVENAMKYGGQTSPDELRVRVRAAIATDGRGASVLVLEVANTGEWVEHPPGAPNRSSGIGLNNLRQRLQRQHPNRHDVAIDARGGWVTVTLRIADPALAAAVPAAPVPSP
jgi:hypothetical protein